MYQQWGEAIYATPLTSKPTPKGLEIAFPDKKIFPTHRKDLGALYSHSAELTVSPLEFKPTQALLDNYSDWAVDIEMVSAEQSMRATLSHGSPYVYLRSSKGGFSISFAEAFTARIADKYKKVLLISNITRGCFGKASDGYIS